MGNKNRYDSLLLITVFVLISALCACHAEVDLHEEPAFEAGPHEGPPTNVFNNRENHHWKALEEYNHLQKAGMCANWNEYIYI